MLRAAIEASRTERRGGSSREQIDVLDDSSDGGLPQSHFQQEDDDLAHAISLSLEMAEQEKAIRELQVVEEEEGLGVHDLLDKEKKTNSSRSQLEFGTSSDQNVAQDVAQPVSHSSNHSAGGHSQQNEDVFLADKWGGISSEELNEALLVETALFGEISSHSSHNFSSLPNLQHHPEKNVDPKMQCLSTSTSQLLTDTRLLKQQQELGKMLDKKEVRLSKEPLLDDEVITIVVRMPDGGRCERRFLKTDKLLLLFDFIDIYGAQKPGTYRLVKSYPRRAYSINDSSSTFNEVGLSSNSEALFLELI
ncbi:Plant UBX domain-containing protein 9 [Spatholobus suberectus]|nr:Plant UBX domain-containing protein 9 [Spatholobus suberectus]